MDSLPGLKQPEVTTRRRRIVFITFCILSIVGVLLRIEISQLGYTDDLEEWHIVTELTLAGKNVYASTDRYSYGPTWMVVLHALGLIQQKLHMPPPGPAAFHAIIASVLSLADVLLAACLLHRGGLAAAALILINPILILLTGCHSQVDTLAILAGVAGWMLIEPAVRSSSPIPRSRLLASAALMALSLSVKHVMLFFPFWMLLGKNIIPQRRDRVLYAAAAYGLFLASFIPFALAPGALRGIWEHVFNYTGLPSQQTLVAGVCNLLLPVQTIERLIPGASTHIHKTIFFGGMCLIGWLLARDRPLEMFDRYLAAMMMLLPSAAPQYLAIPLAACAMMYRRWPAWTYFVAGFAYLFVSPWNVFPHYLRHGKWLTPYYHEFSFWHVQIWAAALLFSGWLSVRRARCQSAS